MKLRDQLASLLLGYDVSEFKQMANKATSLAVDLNNRLTAMTSKVERLERAYNESVKERDALRPQLSALRIERDSLRRTMRQIALSATPGANGTVQRICKMASEAAGMRDTPTSVRELGRKAVPAAELPGFQHAQQPIKFEPIHTIVPSIGTTCSTVSDAASSCAGGE